VSFSLTLTAARLVAAPRPRVWRVFSRMVDWPSWHPRPVRLHRGQELEPGAEFSLYLRPLGLPLSVRARVIESLPERRVAWQGRMLGITSRHSFSFWDARGGTLVESRERLRGWNLMWLRPLYSTTRLGRLGQQWLAALAARAEAGE
jgi:ligand-binding SRPBCC domain-containing protein